MSKGLGCNCQDDQTKILQSMNHNEDLEVIEDVLTRKEKILVPGDPMKDVSLILAIYGLSEVSAIRQKLSSIYQPIV